MTSAPRVGLLSLEPWDDVWRRNQHLASRLVTSKAIESIVFVTPPVGGLAVRARRHYPLRDIEVVTPPLIIPRRYGGYHILGAWLRRTLAEVDVLWINDPVAGCGVLRDGQPAVYDVTDDWREMAQSSSERARIVAAEDVLARRSRVIVCSAALAERWSARYGIETQVIRNGVDYEAIRSARRRHLPGARPHMVYVGTQHANRLDVGLVASLAAQPGTVHLIGPNYLGQQASESLSALGVRLHGAVSAADVPSWLTSADVLICPHVVDPFTLSLDAIKLHEYLATNLPVVATPTSGFQSIASPGLWVADRKHFPTIVREATGTGPHDREPSSSWDDRAGEFASILGR